MDEKNREYVAELNKVRKHIRELEREFFDFDTVNQRYIIPVTRDIFRMFYYLSNQELNRLYEHIGSTICKNHGVKYLTNGDVAMITSQIEAAKDKFQRLIDYGNNDKDITRFC